MPIVFNIYLETDGTWYPKHPELAGMVSHRGPEPREEVRQRMFESVEENFPGVYTLDYDLDTLRQSCHAKINARSDALIEAGYEFEGGIFSASEKAQIRLTNMKLAANVFPYPYAVSSLDDRSVAVLQDAAHMVAFCDALFNHIAYVVGYGAVLKQSINESGMTAEQLLAFEDPRPLPENIPTEPEQNAAAPEQPPEEA